MIRPCPTNAFYGHDRILAAYCGIDPERIAGRIQHGWQPGPDALMQDEYGRTVPLFVWTEKMRAACLRAGAHGPVHVIGSPYLYLPPEATTIAERKPLLVVPSHSIVSKRLGEGTWRAFMARLPTGADVLLHPVDYYLTNVSDFLRDAGHEVLCVSPGERRDGKEHGNEPDFLARLRRILRGYHMVESNRVSTVLFYAIREMCVAAVDCGMPVRTDPPDFCDDVTSDADWANANFPGIFGLAPIKQALEARDELGVRLVAADLARILTEPY